MYAPPDTQPLRSFLETQTQTRGGLASPETAAYLAAFFTSSPFARSLLCKVNSIVATKSTGVAYELTKTFAREFCSPQEAVCLLNDLGFSMSAWERFVSFGHQKSVRFLEKYHVRVPKALPSLARVEQAWYGLAAVCKLEAPMVYYPTCTVGVSWPFADWFEYVQRQNCLWESILPDNDGGLTFIIRGDGFPIAGTCWSQLNVALRNHGQLARRVSHMWPLSLTYSDEKDMGALCAVWKTNIQVVRMCYSI